MNHPTMNTETNAAPDVAADTATSEPVETQEVTTPESNEASTPETDAKPEAADDADKSLKRLQRRIDRVTAARYQAEAEARQLREQLQQYSQRETPTQEEQQIRPEDIERIANERAKQIRELETVSKRSHEIRDALVKEVGQGSLSQILAAVTEEAGPLAHEDGRWTPLGEAIADSEQPAKLLAYLGKNPEAAESLQGLTAAQLGRRIARMEAEMSTPKPSKAPRPLDPIKGQSEVTKDPAEMSDKEFAAWRREQIAKRR